MNLDAISRAANENTDPDPSERDFGELMANALRVCLDDLLANRGPMTDEQRKAMFARMEGGGGGGGSSPRQAKWYDKDVLKAAGSGFLEGANNAAEKGLAKLSFGLTDKIGFTDSTRPELQWSGYDAADQNAELARTALITALGLKAGSAAWSTWRARQAAAAAAGAGSRKFTSTGQDFWNNPGAWKSQNLAAKLEASQEKLIRKALTHGVDKNEAAYIREMLWDKKDLFRNPAGGGPVEWRDVASAYGFDGPRLDAALRVIEQGARPASSNPLGTLAAREAQLLQRAANMGRAIRGSAMPYTLTPQDVYGNRTPPALLFLANARLVADDFIANAFGSDSQRRAFFARQRGGGKRRETDKTKQTGGPANSVGGQYVTPQGMVDQGQGPHPINTFNEKEWREGVQSITDPLDPRLGLTPEEYAARVQLMNNPTPGSSGVGRWHEAQTAAKISGVDPYQIWADMENQWASARGAAVTGGAYTAEDMKALEKAYPGYYTKLMGNRAPATLLETAVRVARTPDAVLANARRPLTDDQKRAIFAKSGGGGGRGRIVQTVIGKDPNTDFRYGGSGDLNRDSRNAHRTQTQQPQAAPGMAGPGNVPKAQDPRYNTPEWKKWKRDVATATTRGGGGSYDSTGFRMGDGTVIPYPTAVGGPQNLPPQLAGIQPFAPPSHQPGDLNFAGGTPYFDERLGRYLTPAEQAAKNAQISQLLAMLPGYVQQPQPAPAPAPAPAPEPVAPPPEWMPTPQPSGGSGLVGIQPSLPPVNHVAPPSGPITPPQPQPPTTPEPQPEPEPEPPAPTPPTGGGSNEGTPSWSVPGYGNPALPTRGAPSKAEPAEKAKMPQITPAMLERLRKRIAGE